MISKDIDPSLRTGEPRLESLDDGFSPPRREQPPSAPPQGACEAPDPPVLDLGPKSPF